MSDTIIRAHLPGSRLQLVAAWATDLSRHARETHGCYPTAAGLFAQTLTAGLLLGGLQRGEARVNLRIECDGPIHGLFADANPSGQVRGFIRNAKVDFPGREGPFRAQGALGSKGFVSVLRDLGGGESYRGMVNLAVESGACELPELLERYFAQSEQTETALALAVRPEGPELLGHVSGLLIQALPDGDKALLGRIREALRGGWLDAAHPDRSHGSMDWLAPLFGGELPELIDEHPAFYHCGCSKERVVRALMALGKEELAELWIAQGKADATCEFCGASYHVSSEELVALFTPDKAERN